MGAGELLELVLVLSVFVSQGTCGHRGDSHISAVGGCWEEKPATLLSTTREDFVIARDVSSDT